MKLKSLLSSLALLLVLPAVVSSTASAQAAFPELERITRSK